MGPDPILASAAWHLAVIGGLTTPGIAAVSGGARVLKWDSAKGYGTSGAYTKFTGADLTEFVLNLAFYDRAFGLRDHEQIAYYQDQILPVLQRSESGKVALDFYHPAVSEPPCNVRAVVPTSIGQLKELDDTGLWGVEIKFKHYVAPKPAVGRPTTTASSKKKDTAKDATDRELDALTKQFKDLAGDFFS